jgi:hypothetical protein
MIREFPTYIANALVQEQEDLPRNPGITAFIQAKITLLRNPALANEIVNGQFWYETSVTSMNGRSIPVVVLYPQAAMRNDAAQAVNDVSRGLPVLEGFMAAPFPHGFIRIWYGFITGNSGGGGMLDMEDRVSYESRTGPSRLPYDAILHHELSHSYISNESLTQFLELYIYNTLATGSSNMESWVFTRNYVPELPSNQDSAALLDVYQLIGHDGMARAYRAVYPLRPPYGQPLSDDCQRAFIDQASEPVRAAVAALVARVTF